MPEISPSKYLVSCGWDDVPHLDEKTKKELLAATPPHLRDARSKGIPSLGSGAIYPVAESEIIIEPFKIPGFFPRAYAMDVGWNKTAALWGAKDPDANIIYLYSEHYKGQAEPSIHAQAIRSRDDWIKGCIDPASRGRSQKDGVALFDVYRDLGLTLIPAENAVESGIYDVWQRLSGGGLRIFSSLSNTLAEYRLYRRDEKGKIVKEFDHLMDCMRYLVVNFDRIAQTEPFDYEETSVNPTRSSVTGY